MPFLSADVAAYDKQESFCKKFSFDLYSLSITAWFIFFQLYWIAVRVSDLRSFILEELLFYCMVLYSFSLARRSIFLYYFFLFKFFCISKNGCTCYIKSCCVFTDLSGLVFLLRSFLKLIDSASVVFGV